MFEFLIALVLATLLMIVLMAVGVGLTMPFHGALVRLRANYNPRAVGLEGTENRVGPTLNTLVQTLKRTKRLEGWYGLYKGSYPMLIFFTLVSIASVIFVGGSSTRGPKGTYSTPPAGGIRMGIFTIILTLISLPMTIIINRAIITPYRLPINPRTSLSILLTPLELAAPWKLYLTPGLLATTATHSICVTFLARTVRVGVLGVSDPSDAEASIAAWRWIIFLIFQATATIWLTPLEIIGTRLSVQPNTGGLQAIPSEEEGLPEGVEYAGTNEDVIGLRPTTDPYEGMLDCARKLVDEEGWQSLYRGWWWTMGSNIFGVVG
ncbi:mitochondrial carrier domain-containing protein [Naematelia encephala]|uniref:Mitochondrial carrier domain-containing protein n=1 Tax=Naematelia encephala TaxID=71784 RepID=A0A1Y2BDX5_9TREE|nr:mitochondrial carrier domain-containing protein [Naematelia encephala]